MAGDPRMTQVKKFFEMDAKAFVSEWRELTDDDKEQLKAGVADGTLTY